MYLCVFTFIPISSLSVCMYPYIMYMITSYYILSSSSHHFRVRVTSFLLQQNIYEVYKIKIVGSELCCLSKIDQGRRAGVSKHSNKNTSRKERITIQQHCLKRPHHHHDHHHQPFSLQLLFKTHFLV